MRVAPLSLIAFAICTQQPAAAANRSGRDLVDECYAFSPAAARECLAKNLRKTTTELRATENKAMAALSKWDEEPKYIATAKEKLRTSNAAFEQYREAQCAFSYSLGGGAIGNALDMRRLACSIEENSKRITEISALVSPLPLK